jgi:hypothetical protein
MVIDEAHMATVEFFRRSIHQYAVACDLFPELTAVWDIHYLEQCHDEYRIPIPERLLGPLEEVLPPREG